MMSLEVIRYLNEEIAAQAAAEQRLPFVFGHRAGLGLADLRRIPNLGPYVPEDWEVVGQGYEGE